MKIFKILQKNYAILGISSSSLNQSTQIYPFSDRVFFGFLLFAYSFVSHVVYIFYVASNFMECMEGICTTCGSIMMCVCFAAIVFRQTTVFKCIDDIENLIDTRSKYSKSKRFFLKSIEQVEKLSEDIFMVIVKITVQLIMLPKFIISFGTFIIGNSECDSFALPLPMWFPFDTNNPIGYLIAFVLEYITIGYELFTAACSLTIGFGACWFVISATSDIQRILHLIDDKTQAKKNQLNELKILLVEFVDIHGILKQVEHQFSKLFQPMAMSVFTWSLLAMSGALLIFQVELDHGNIWPLLLLILSGIIGFGIVCIACELGQRINDIFDEINFNIGKFDWYLFPIEIKRMLPMFIAIAQKPVKMECFGSIAWTREVFRKVIRRAFSYFMVLRQLSH